MAYQTGTFTSQNDLLDKIRIFLTGNGWTQNGYTTDGSGYRLHLSKGSIYANLRSLYNENTFTGKNYNHNGIAVNLSTGYNASNDWDEQPGYTQRTSGNAAGSIMADFTSGVSYFIVANSNNVFIVVEGTVGVFFQMAWGEFTGLTATTWFVTANVAWYGISAIANSRGFFYTDSSSNSGNTYFYYGTTWYDQEGVQPGFVPAYDNTAFSPVQNLVDCSPNNFNGVSTLWNTYSFLRISSIFRYVGTVEELRALSIQNYDVKEEYNDGTNTWIIFPMYDKDNTSKNGRRGFALKKIT